MRLFHFTCAHGREGVGNYGLLEPRPHPFLPELGPVVWLTDNPTPTAGQLGLIGDRLSFRYLVPTLPAWLMPWSVARDECDPLLAKRLEAGCDSASWWLSDRPVSAHLDPMRQHNAGEWRPYEASLLTRKGS